MVWVKSSCFICKSPIKGLVLTWVDFWKSFFTCRVLGKRTFSLMQLGFNLAWSCLIFFSLTFISFSINLVPSVIFFFNWFLIAVNSTILELILLRFSTSDSNLVFFNSSSSLFLLINSFNFSWSFKLSSWSFLKLSS